MIGSYGKREGFSVDWVLEWADFLWILIEFIYFFFRDFRIVFNIKDIV